MKGSSIPRGVSENERIDWELRPGGMLIQKRDDGGGASGPMIKIKVSHGSYQHDITVPAQATFGHGSQNGLMTVSEFLDFK